MTAPPPKRTILRLARSIPRYDFSKEPLLSADIVIERNGRICKDLDGDVGRAATELELVSSEDVKPNR